MNPSHLKNYFVIFLGIMLGRVTGLGRDLLVLKKFGISLETDLINIFLFIPDLINTIFVGAAVSLVFIPIFTNGKNRSTVNYYFHFNIFLIILSLLILTAINFQYIDFLSLFYDAIDEAEYSVLEANEFFLYLSILGSVLCSVSISLLNANSKFFYTNYCTIVFNIAIIIGLIALVPDSIQTNIAAIIFIACLAKAIFLFFPSLKILKLKLFDLRLFFRLINIRLIKTYFIALSTCGIIILIPIVLRFYASSFGVGYYSEMNYVLKVNELVSGVVITGFSLISFPIMVKLVKKEDFQGLMILNSRIIFYLLIISSLYVLVCATFAQDILEYFLGSVSDSAYYSNLIYYSSFAFFPSSMIVLYLNIFATLKKWYTPNILILFCLPILFLSLRISENLKQILLGMNLFYLALFGVMTATLLITFRSKVK